MKVVTFNLRCADDPNGNSIAERAPRLKKVLEKYDADLLGFQEATPFWLECLERDYGADYEIFNFWRSKTNHESTPMMWRKSRFTCLKKGYFWLSDTPDIESVGWDTLGCNRICMWAKLRDNQDGSELVFFNTHYGFGDPCQLDSGRLILAHMAALKADCAILTADFNMRPDAPGYKLLAERLVDVNAATAKDPGTTYTGYRLDHTGSLIDFCFVSPETITPVSSVRMTDLVDGKFPSDHYGVCSEIILHAKLKLITFNVKNNGGPTPAEERARKLRSTLGKYSPDVFGLQEVTPIFAEKLSRLSGYDCALQYRLENQQEATPIYWKKDVFDLIHQEFFWLSETPEKAGPGFGGQYARICTLVVLQYKGGSRRICYVNTHFDFSDENHVASAKLIAEKVAPYGDMPILVTADFNMHIGGPGYRAMRETFKDVRWEVAPGDFTPTYNGMGADMTPPMIIDYVFTNGVKIRPLSYHVIDDRPGGMYISDHNGISAVFVVE